MYMILFLLEIISSAAHFYPNAWHLPFSHPTRVYALFLPAPAARQHLKQYIQCGQGNRASRGVGR
jgi:hypothetical protein